MMQARSFDEHRGLRATIKRFLFVDIPTHPDPSFRPYLGVDREVRMLLEEIASIGAVWSRKKLRSYSRGPLVLASVLRLHGIEISYANPTFMSQEEIDHKICASDVVGVSAATPFVRDGQRMIERAKRLHPEIITILGGPHATALGVEFLQECPTLDLAIAGDAESALTKLVSDTPLREIEGIVFRRKRGGLRRNPPQYVPPNLMMAPDYSLLPGDLSEYRINLQTARGCWFQCAFCAGGDVQVREMTQSTIDEELKQMEALPQGTAVHICDTNLAQSDSYLRRVCQLLRDHEGKRFHYSCDVRAGSMVDPSTWSLLEETGFTQVCIGFETSNTDCLRIVGKELSFQDNLRMARTIKQNSSLQVYAYWIIGLPGSTADSIRRDAETAAGLIIDGEVDFVSPTIILVPLPGSRLFANPEKFGARITTRDWSLYYRSQVSPVFELSEIDGVTLSELHVEFLQQLISAYTQRYAEAAEAIRDRSQEK